MYAIVMSEFNASITENLLEGCLKTLSSRALLRET